MGQFKQQDDDGRVNNKNDVSNDARHIEETTSTKLWRMEFRFHFDTATTRTITPCFDDLIDPVKYKTGLLGIGRSEITHKGIFRWNGMDNSGKNSSIGR